MKKCITTLVFITTVFTSLSIWSAPYHGRDMIFRVGLSNVTPKDDFTKVTLNGRPSRKGTTLSIDEGQQANLTFQYFFGRSLALEFMTSFAGKHDIHYQNYPDVGDEGVMGDVKQVPLTLNLLYYPDKSWFIKPYAGFGVNYTFFYDETVATDKRNFIRYLDFDNKFALAGQLGLDIQLSKSWSLNTSARYYDLSTEVNFRLGPGGSTRARAKMKFDPLIYSLMVGYKF